MHFKKGDYDRALQFLQKALALNLKIFGERHPDVGRTYVMLGALFHAKGDSGATLRYFEKALDIRRESLGEKHPDVAVVYNAMSEAYLNAGDTRRALAYCRKALKISKAATGEQHPAVATIYQAISNIYLRSGEAKAALQFARKACDIQRAVSGKTHPELAKSYVLLAKAEQHLGNEKRALAHLQNAFQANVPGFDAGDQKTGLALGKILSDEVLLEALQLKARILTARFQRSGKLEDALAAHTALQQAVTLLDRMRSGFKAAGSKLVLAEKAMPVYERAIHLSLALYRASGDARYREQAFRYAEKAKAAVLREAIRAAEATRFAGIPDSLLKQEVLRIEDLFKKNYGLAARLGNLLSGEKTRVYLEDEATETSLKQAPLDRYRYLHFATHGFANKNTPDLSGLVLAGKSKVEALRVAKQQLMRITPEYARPYYWAPFVLIGR